MPIIDVLRPNPPLECRNETILGDGPFISLSLVEDSKARKVLISESEPTLWKASRETATICNTTCGVKARLEVCLTLPLVSEISEFKEVRTLSPALFCTPTGGCSCLAFSKPAESSFTKGAYAVSMTGPRQKRRPFGKQETDGLGPECPVIRGCVSWRTRKVRMKVSACSIPTTRFGRRNG